MQNPARSALTSGGCASSRRLAVVYAKQARVLERRVSRCARTSTPHTVEDACAFAWLQLLTRPQLDLQREQALLRWLEQTATREAWKIEARRARDGIVDDVVLEHRPGAQTVPGVDELAAQRERIALVEQLPERPRRFLWRLALGHSYREIADDERVSVTTTNKQIARAKRLLRAAAAERSSPQPAPAGVLPRASARAR